MPGSGDDSDILTYSRDLLDSYATRMPDWKRFITGNNSNAPLLYPFNRLWGRHHLPEVNQIRANLDDLNALYLNTTKYLVQNTVDLLYRLHAIALVNQNGSLAKRIRHIWEQALQPDFIHLLTQEMDVSERGRNIKTNGLVLAMRHYPNAVDRLLEGIMQMESSEDQRSVLKNALIYAMGENQETHSPDSETIIYENWHYLPVAERILQAIHPLGFTDQKKILIPALLKAWHSNRLQTYDQILETLFAKYPEPPSNEYRAWILVMLSTQESNPDFDNTDDILDALDKAIGETAINVPANLLTKANISRVLNPGASSRYTVTLFQPQPDDDSKTVHIPAYNVARQR